MLCVFQEWKKPQLLLLSSPISLWSWARMNHRVQENVKQLLTEVIVFQSDFFLTINCVWLCSKSGHICNCLSLIMLFLKIKDNTFEKLFHHPWVIIKRLCDMALWRFDPMPHTWDASTTLSHLGLTYESEIYWSSGV